MGAKSANGSTGAWRGKRSMSVASSRPARATRSLKGDSGLSEDDGLCQAAPKSSLAAKTAVCVGRAFM